jgi:hypothetical protein
MFKTGKRSMSLLVIFVFLTAPVAFAQDSESLRARGFLKNVYAELSGDYMGTSLSDPTSFTPEEDASWGDEQTVRNSLGLGWRLSESKSVGIAFEMNLQPEAEKATTIDDTYLTYAVEDLIDIERVSTRLDIRAYLPTSDQSRIHDLAFGLRSTQEISYLIPRSRFEVGIETMFRRNIFGSRIVELDDEDDGRILHSSHISPFVNYLITEGFNLTLLLESKFNHRLDTDFSQWERDYAILRPGFSWEAADEVILSPYLNIYPGNISMASTYFGVEFEFKLL